jgi:hypothetical protein
VDVDGLHTGRRSDAFIVYSSRSHKVYVAPHHYFAHCELRGVRVASYYEEDARRILRCATCDATVFAEVACVGPADANSVCVLCGMTIADLPFEGGDYFDVLMRVGRTMGRATRFRRTR